MAEQQQGTAVTAAAGMASGAVSLRRVRSPRATGERAIEVLLLLAAVLSVVTTALIVFSLAEQTVAFFGQVGVAEFLLGTKWTPLLGGDQQSFGVVPLVFATFYITGIALVVAVPLGLLSAIYLAEYASPRVRRAVKPVLEVLAGVPTIVLGYFALSFFTPEVLKPLIDGTGTNNQLAAGILVGVLVIPTVASVAEDAMTAVPAALREGAFGMGANRMQVALRVVLPAALSGVVAGLVLGASRAVGETVVILLAAGNGQLLPDGVVGDVREPAGSMAAFVAGTAGGDVPTGSIEYQTIFVIGFTLFAITFLMNILSIRLVDRFRQVYE